MTKLYKIRHKPTGLLFQKRCVWNNRGKIYKRKPLYSYMVSGYYPYERIMLPSGEWEPAEDVKDQFEIVTFEMNEVDVVPISSAE